MLLLWHFMLLPELPPLIQLAVVVRPKSLAFPTHSFACKDRRHWEMLFVPELGSVGTSAVSQSQKL